MSTNEIISAAQAVIDEAAALAARKAQAISELREQREAIDKALVALGAGVAPEKKRKAVSETARKNMSAAQRRRFEKGGEQQTPEANT